MEDEVSCTACLRGPMLAKDETCHKHSKAKTNKTTDLCVAGSVAHQKIAANFQLHMQSHIARRLDRKTSESGRSVRNVYDPLGVWK